MQLLQFQTDVSSARLAKVQALAGLRELLGYDAAPAGFDVTAIWPTCRSSRKLEDLQAMALHQRPDLQAADLESAQPRARSFWQRQTPR